MGYRGGGQVVGWGIDPWVQRRSSGTGMPRGKMGGGGQEERGQEGTGGGGCCHEGLR